MTPIKAAGLALAAAGLFTITAGCTSSETAPAFRPHVAGLSIPRAFWSHRNPLIRTAFPHAAGLTTACTIVAASALKTIGIWRAAFPGMCTTQVEHPDSAGRDPLPAPTRAQAYAVVTLNESWGARHSATFVYVISKDGHVLTARVSGQPPQLWRCHWTSPNSEECPSVSGQ